MNQLLVDSTQMYFFMIPTHDILHILSLLVKWV